MSFNTLKSEILEPPSAKPIFLQVSDIYLRLVEPVRGVREAQPRLLQLNLLFLQ